MIKRSRRGQLILKKKLGERNASKELPVNYYVDNEKLYKALVDFNKKVNQAKRKKEPKPPIPEYIGECFLAIAKNLAYRGNFINYTFKDEMISDGVENCVQYVSNFDTKKYFKPFAYFTTVIFQAFVRRINKERKHSYIKYKLMDRMDLDFDDPDNPMNPKKGSSARNFEKFKNEFVQNFEESKKKKAEKTKSKAKSKLEKLLKDED